MHSPHGPSKLNRQANEEQYAGAKAGAAIGPRTLFSENGKNSNLEVWSFAQVAQTLLRYDRYRVHDYARGAGQGLRSLLGIPARHKLPRTGA